MKQRKTKKEVMMSIWKHAIFNSLLLANKKPESWTLKILISISRFFIRNLPFHNFLNPPKVLRDFRKLFQSFQSSNWNKKIAKWNTFTMHKKFMKLKWESSKSRFWCFIGQQEWFENCIFPNWHHDLLFHKSITLFQFFFFSSWRWKDHS